MQFMYISALLISITCALAVPLPKRGPIAGAYTQLVIKDIGNIDKAVQKLTTSIEAYQGGIVEASPLFAGVLDIHLVNRKAFVDAQPPVHANDAESKKIVVFTEKSVGQSIPASVKALESKRRPLKDAGVTAFVVPGLKLLLHDHDTYSAELLEKVSPNLLDRAQAVVDKIHNAIQDGIEYFQ